MTFIFLFKSLYGSKCLISVKILKVTICESTGTHFDWLPVHFIYINFIYFFYKVILRAFTRAIR